MNTPSKELKRRARASLTGNYFTVTSLATSLALFFFALSLLPPYSGFANGDDALSHCLYWVLWGIVLLLKSLMEVGLIRFIYFLKPRQTQKQPSRLFYGFRNQSDTFLLSYAFRYLITLIWFVPAVACYIQIPKGQEPSRLIAALFPVFLLFLAGVLPAMITALPFCLATYVLLDHPEYSTLEALNTSLHLMRGQKKRLLGLWLSFLPFVFLILGSSGIAFLWIQPYFHAIMAQFYRDVNPHPFFVEQ